MVHKMQKSIVITHDLLAAFNAIKAAGHCVEIDSEQDGGKNSHTNTYLTLFSVGYSKRLRVRHTTSYSGQFSEWAGISREFEELCYLQYPKVDLLLDRFTDLVGSEKALDEKEDDGLSM